MEEERDEHLIRPVRLELGIALIALLLLAVWMLFGGIPGRNVDSHKLNPHTYDTTDP